MLPNSAQLLLDIEVTKTTAPKSGEELWAAIHSLREPKNQIFFSCITKEWEARLRDDVCPNGSPQDENIEWRDYVNQAQETLSPGCALELLSRREPGNPLCRSHLRGRTPSRSDDGFVHFA